jgi:hypothetical protein
MAIAASSSPQITQRYRPVVGSGASAVITSRSS